MILGMAGDLAPQLAADDAVIDGGNSYHHDDIRRVKTLPDIFEACRPGNQLGPDVAIAFVVASKAPGEAMVGQEVELLATQGVGTGMGAFERLLGDAMRGDSTLFAREDAVEAQWRIVAPILTGREPSHEYQPGTWGPVEADGLIGRSGGWHAPQPAPMTGVSKANERALPSRES